MGHFYQVEDKAILRGRPEDIMDSFGEQHYVITIYCICWSSYIEFKTQFSVFAFQETPNFKS